MKPGSLRLVAFRGIRDRLVYNFSVEELAFEDAFHGAWDQLEAAGYIVYVYTMTESGWTEL